jgi:hypothetical protein
MIANPINKSNIIVFNTVLDKIMPISEPRLVSTIDEKVHTFMNTLQNEVSKYHIDGHVMLLGILRNGLGAKIEINNIERIDETELCIWQDMARRSGAVRADFEANFDNGQIILDVEYKRPSLSFQYCEWLIYPIILVSLMMCLKLL